MLQAASCSNLGAEPVQITPAVEGQVVKLRGLALGDGTSFNVLCDQKVLTGQPICSNVCAHLPVLAEESPPYFESEPGKTLSLQFTGNGGRGIVVFTVEPQLTPVEFEPTGGAGGGGGSAESSASSSDGSSSSTEKPSKKSHK